MKICVLFLQKSKSGWNIRFGMPHPLLLSHNTMQRWSCFSPPASHSLQTGEPDYLVYRFMSMCSQVGLGIISTLTLPSAAASMTVWTSAPPPRVARSR
jgi:hypothetical protein